MPPCVVVMHFFRLEARSRMLPTGPFLLFNANEELLLRFQRALRANLGAEQEAPMLRLGDRCVLGCVAARKTAQPPVLHELLEAGAAGVFDGMLFEECALEATPAAALRLEIHEQGLQPNGLFLAVAADRDRCRMMSDAWGSMPMYHRFAGSAFAASTSLALLLALEDEVRWDEYGVAQFLNFSRTLGGRTLYEGIRRLGAGHVLDITLDGSDRATIKSDSRWLRLRVEPRVRKDEAEAIVSSFTQACATIVARVGDGALCTLSGGYDSRAIVAGVLLAGCATRFVTHRTRDGHDVRVARLVAQRLRLEHKEIALSATLPFDEGNGVDFVRMSNGFPGLGYYHSMAAFPAYARLGSHMVDGVHSSIEGRWFHRQGVARLRSKDTFFHATVALLTRSGMLRWVRDTDRVRRMAEESLWDITPDPRHHASPACCADMFNIEHCLPNHDTDMALLQNQYCRFISPYFDLRYVRVIAEVDERKRWRQYPQCAIMSALDPGLLRIPRVFGDVLSPPVAQPVLQRIPLAVQRLLIDRHASLHRFTLRDPSLATEYPLELPPSMIVVPEFLDEKALRLALPSASGVPVDSALYPVFPLLLHERVLRHSLAPA